MTSYGYDPDSGNLVAVWHTPDGPRAHVVEAHAGDHELMLRLAGQLHLLNQQVWRTFTAPASAAGNADEVNSEAWRRQTERDCFDEALRAVREPNLPDHGMLIQSYIPVLEAAHSVGRALHTVGDPILTDAVQAEVGAELGAVELAELGDLSGRAAQATALSRAAASPLQVEAASAALAEDLFEASLGRFEPPAAAVAAAHWLQAAAEVAGEISDTDWTEVVARSDDIAALPTQTPTVVLDRLAGGEDAADVVTELISDALNVGDGLILDPAELADELAEIDEAILEPVKITLLDPRRPALDLLEDLQSGLYGCYLWWSEHVPFDSDDDTDDEEGDEALESNRMAEFVSLVVAQMAINGDR